MGRSLVLNASDQPLAVVTAQRAVVLVLKEKADVVVSNGAIFHAERFVIEAPSVVRLRYFVRVPYRSRAPLTRRAVFARDDWSCQYCGAPAENLDHVIPKSRGGPHSWGERRGGMPPVQRAQGEPPGSRRRPASSAQALRSLGRVQALPRPGRPRLGALPLAGVTPPQVSVPPLPSRTSYLCLQG